jgi:hypothetical protein
MVMSRIASAWTRVLPFNKRYTRAPVTQSAFLLLLNTEDSIHGSQISAFCVVGADGGRAVVWQEEWQGILRLRVELYVMRSSICVHVFQRCTSQVRDAVCPVTEHR